jgi:hypothetical protein
VLEKQVNKANYCAAGDMAIRAFEFVDTSVLISCYMVAKHFKSHRFFEQYFLAYMASSRFSSLRKHTILSCQ